MSERAVDEVIGGIQYTTTGRTGRCVRAWSVLNTRIGVPFDLETRLWWIAYKPELHLGDDLLVPDLCGWRRTTLPEFPLGAFVDVAPEWACEIVSAETARLDRVKKMPAYARHGVTRVWIIDPEPRTLEIYRLERSHYSLMETFDNDATVRAEPFEEIELPLADLWL